MVWPWGKKAKRKRKLTDVDIEYEIFYHFGKHYPQLARKALRTPKRPMPRSFLQPPDDHRDDIAIMQGLMASTAADAAFEAKCLAWQDEQRKRLNDQEEPAGD